MTNTEHRMRARFAQLLGASLRASLGAAMMAHTFTMALVITAPMSLAAKPTDSQRRALVPQQLLGLVHAPEVHQELGLSQEQTKKLESLFARIDGEWFRARNLTQDQQYSTISRLENQVKQWFQTNATAEQTERLRQLEYRALGMRMLLRPELSQSLELTDSQLTSLADLAQAVNDANEKLRQATMRNAVTQEQKDSVFQATQAEQQALQTVVKPEQIQKLGQILGQPFDTTQLKRIYPMAPELEPVQHWINSQPFSLKDLRGKVVVLHFYAFQCHNCHANFGHYKKWHDKYDREEVVVLGIQRPETSRERDPTAVRKAAKETDLRFPIMVDLESKNWNAWSNTMWPTVYVIDKQGYIRQWWQGELNWQGATGDQRIEGIINDLLLEDA